MDNGLYNGTGTGLYNGLKSGTANGLSNGLYGERFIKPEIIKEGLKLFLDFSNAGCYNYGAGVVGKTIYDLSGNKNNGTIANNLVLGGDYWASNPIPRWNNFTINPTVGRSWISFSGNSLFNLGTNSYSASLWFRPENTTTSDYQGLIGKSYFGNLIGRWGVHVMSSLRIGALFQHNTGQIEVTSPSNTLVVEKWHFITVVIDRFNGVKVYMNNSVLLNDTTNTAGQDLNSNQPFQIGNYGALANNTESRGQMQYPMVYNRPLSFVEHKYNYEVTKKYFGL